MRAFIHVKYLLLLVFLYLVSCSKREKEAQTYIPTVGEYVYLDDNDIYHINPSCIKLLRGNDDAGHDIYAKHLIDTADFIITNPKYFRVCTRCVGDTEYEHLSAISDSNKRFNEAKLSLYNKFVEADYDVPNFDTFSNAIDRTEVRHRLYQIAQEEKWDVGKTEEEFSNSLGYPK